MDGLDLVSVVYVGVIVLTFVAQMRLLQVPTNHVRVDARLAAIHFYATA